MERLGLGRQRICPKNYRKKGAFCRISHVLSEDPLSDGAHGKDVINAQSGIYRHYINNHI